MDKTLDLPYTKSPFDEDFKVDSKKYYKYAKNIFTPYFKKCVKKSKYIKISNFLHPKPVDHILGIKNLKQQVGYAKEPYFLYFDVKKYYPTVDHNKLKILLVKHYLYSRNCRNLEDKTFDELKKHKKITVYFKRFLKYLEKYLSYSNFPGVGLLSSNPVTFILSEIYLFDFFLGIQAHTFRWNDDFFICMRKKDEINFEFKSFIQPNIENLDLKLNPDKVVIGKLFENEVSYIGFTFKKGGFVHIQEHRINEYLEKVKNIFYKKVNETLKNKIKKLRNLQFGFFYYYRICDIKYIWKSLSSQTRDRVRGYLFLYKKEWKTRFFITNDNLEKLGIINFLDLKF